MEKKSRSELLEVIEDQNEILETYKVRLRDVVGQYKNLVKERDALEESIKILTEVNSSSENKELRVREGSEVQAKDVGSSSYNLESLKMSLRTLTAEKARAENDYKSDRKTLLKEIRDLKSHFTESESKWREEKIKFSSCIQELKKQIRDQQKDREKEQQDYAVMLKELQCLLADERVCKEKFEQQVKDLKQTLKKVTESKTLEYEKQIKELQQELKMTKKSLQEKEDEVKDTPRLLLQLQEEMAEMKKHHHQAVIHETKRANEAEEKLQALAAVSEERAAGLEARLTELSQMVGNYDQLRQQDLIAIQKLKDRLTQLDLENSALARTVSNKKYSCDFEDDSNLDVQTLIERIKKLKSCLYLANQRSKKPINITDFWSNTLKEVGDNPHAKCQNELKKLKEEFEQYKLQARSFHGDQNRVGECFDGETSILKREITSLKEELQACEIRQKSDEEKFKEEKKKQELSMEKLKLSHKQEISALETEYQTKMADLELQMQKQRKRSLAILDEKEKEICLLKSLDLSRNSGNANTVVKTEKIDEENRTVSRLSQSSANSCPVDDLLSHSLKKGPHFLHYVQEIARKDVEISNLIRARSQAESALRELKQSLAVKEEMYQSEIATMKSQIERLEDQVSGSVNMEYLKNVVMRYITCKDPNGQIHMLNAIGAVLHFTPQEFQEVKKNCVK